MGKDRTVFMNELKIHITRYENGSLHAKLLEANNTNGYATHKNDDKGALLYVCAVILIYGFSIIFMIASLSKKDDKADKGVNRYMKGIDHLRRMERRQEKFKMRLAMQRTKTWKMVGGNTALLENENTTPSPKVNDANTFQSGYVDSNIHPNAIVVDICDTKGKDMKGPIFVRDEDNGKGVFMVCEDNWGQHLDTAALSGVITNVTCNAGQENISRSKELTELDLSLHPVAETEEEESIYV